MLPEMCGLLGCSREMLWTFGSVGQELLLRLMLEDTSRCGGCVFDTFCSIRDTPGFEAISIGLA